MKEKYTIVVWFSCGVASAVAAKLTVEKYKETHTVIVVNNPIKEEHEDNYRFLIDVQTWLGMPIYQATNTEIQTTSAVDVWEKRKYMAGVKGAPCTMLLKKQARYLFEKANDIDWHVLGFTVDEKDRHERFVKYERENVLPILIEAGLTKDDCFRMIEGAGIELPYIYKLGYPNANCIGCVKSTSPTYWNHVRKMHPEVFAARAELSRRIKCKLVRLKGKRIYLDELPADAVGGKMIGYECGIFCDTK
jgi:3'-phosphoadenosine 5'-phosphosulfate sulfotransferase (PAPS reductase)/FAD synthetase